MAQTQNFAQSGLKELRQRLLFVLFGILVYRIGAYIPIPGIDPEKIAYLFHRESGGVLGLFNMISGGALSRVTVFALGVMPYISASIIMQLMSAVSPKLEEIKKEGESGRRKINQYTRYATLVLASIQALVISRWLLSAGSTIIPGVYFYFTTVVTLTTGTIFLMWLGEQITERGVGNGISLIIFAGIVSRFPSALASLTQQVRQGQMMPITLLLIIGVILLVTYCVVFVERGQRRITINYARRQRGKKMYGGQASHLPLKINMAGVIPPIFATSLIVFPSTIARMFGHGTNWFWLTDISYAISPGQPLYFILFTGAIVFFCFFYTAIVFNPRDTADNLKKSGAFIPGIRPGEQTARYIDKVMTRLTLSGSIYLALVALLPEFLILTWNVPFYFGGTSLLIVVVVLMDFMSQIQAHLMSSQYESMMKKAKLTTK